MLVAQFFLGGVSKPGNKHFIHCQAIDGSLRWLNSSLPMSMHLAWNQLSHKSHWMDFWFRLHPLVQTAQGSLTGPGFSITSPASNTKQLAHVAMFTSLIPTAHFKDGDTRVSRRQKRARTELRVGNCLISNPLTTSRMFAFLSSTASTAFTRKELNVSANKIKTTRTRDSRPTAMIPLVLTVVEVVSHGVCHRLRFKLVVTVIYRAVVKLLCDNIPTSIYSAFIRYLWICHNTRIPGVKKRQPNISYDWTTILKNYSNGSHLWNKNKHRRKQFK